MSYKKEKNLNNNTFSPFTSFQLFKFLMNFLHLHLLRQDHCTKFNGSQSCIKVEIFQ